VNTFFPARLVCWALLSLLAAGFVLSAAWGAAAPAEERAYTLAKRSFQDGWYDRAEQELEDFIKTYPDSESLPEAVLLLAECRFKQNQFESAAGLLQSRLAGAGKLADQYYYWLAQARFQQAEYGSAATLFARLLADFPQSPYRLEAGYGEAMARYRSGELSRVVELLTNTTNAFPLAAQARPDHYLVSQADLLLAEVLMAQHDFPAALPPLQRLATRTLSPDLRWKSQYLLSKAYLATQDLTNALQNATNLVALATATGSLTNQAEAVSLTAQILEQAQQPEAAIRFYTNNLAEGIPLEYSYQAFTKVVELRLSRNQTDAAIQWIETFLRNQPQSPAADLALETLGELKLKQYYALRSPTQTQPPETVGVRTNLLQQAKVCFDEVLARFPQSSLTGHAYLNRGWCWLEDGKIAESQADFREATARLPHSKEQAVARFKWADTQFQQKAWADALKNYRLLVDEYGTESWARDELLDQALYQTVQAGVELGEAGQVEATRALERILAWYPDDFYSGQSMLLVGQGFSRVNRPGEARAYFLRYAQAFTNSPFLPQAELAIAQSYVQEQDWTNAFKTYDKWVAQHSNHTSLPQVEYDRAWVHWQAGDSTNALRLFTNFVARFPTHPQAPLAQKWVGDFYLNQGDNRNAELQYQLLYQNTNWPPSPLTYEARLWAGRAAVARQGYANARDYFYWLITNGPPVVPTSDIPPDLVAQAYFALGDTLRLQPVKEGADPLDRFSEAINAYEMIRRNFPTNQLVPAVLGVIANCHLQLATDSEPWRYEAAITNYQEILSLPNASLAVRSEAEVGLGLVLERQASSTNRPATDRPLLLERARNHYLNVLYGKNRRPGEPPDPIWPGKAGLEAARLAESLRMWERAARVYARLMELYPPWRDMLQRKLDKINERLGTAKR
jgi:TolA-binding protein